MTIESKDMIESKVYDRLSTTYENNCKKFLLRDRTFERQYATYYATRLKLSTDVLRQRVRNKWGPSANVKQLCEISGDEKVIVVGTVFKHMELHPSILKEISEEHNVILQPVTEEYTKDDDYLILEDDLQQVVLCGKIDPQTHVTGITIAVSGYTEESGKFYVEDWCYPFVADPDILPHPSIDKYVLLVSGIGLGDPNAMFPFQVLVDLITGQIGETPDQHKFSQLVRVIIAGNSICPPDVRVDKTNFLTRKTRAVTIENMQILDDFISQIVTDVPVDIMPGELDPANHLLPQQPLHPCMFPKSSVFSSFNVVTNPYDVNIDGIRFLGTSGQNIKDISAYSKLPDPLTVMERTLDWGHMLPTAPDTLNCYPFPDKDPFILSQYPHVYFCGNSSKMGFKKYADKEVLMISVPKFQKTYCALLLNLRSFQVHPIVVCDTYPE